MDKILPKLRAIKLPIVAVAGEDQGQTSELHNQARNPIRQKQRPTLFTRMGRFQLLWLTTF